MSTKFAGSVRDDTSLAYVSVSLTIATDDEETEQSMRILAHKSQYQCNDVDKPCKASPLGAGIYVEDGNG